NGFRAVLRGDRRATFFPWNRVIRIGVREGEETYVCVQAAVTWREGDVSVLDDVLRAEIVRPFEIGAPAAFHLLARCRGFGNVLPTLEERMKTTADPAVRDA